MNHTYRLVWNEAARRHVPTAETARARKQGNTLARNCVVALVAGLGSTLASNTHAAPTGGTVVAGQAAIEQSGATTIIRQQSQTASLNWQGFSIGSQETVQFVQPSATAVALNRVVGNDPSVIYGHLLANGQIFLVNPKGVLFGLSAQVNVGSLVASSLDISDEDLLAGNYRFHSRAATSDTAPTPASVINQGSLTASPGGSVALLGGQVSNSGTITAQRGTVALAAGSAMTLDFQGNRLLNVQVDGAAADALAENHQLIQADGGTVIMTAAARNALLKTVVNNTGIIEARTIDDQSGEIKLLGGEDGGTVSVSGTLDASAPTTGDGGHIETSGEHVHVADEARITTAAAHGTTGSWLVDPQDYTIAASGGDISGSALGADLGTTSVTLSSTGGKTSGNGDIFVNDAVSWSAGNTLTLTARGSIWINQSITAQGAGAGVALNFGAGKDYSLSNNAQITLLGAAPKFSINGTNYTVINSLGVDGDISGTTLQGIAGNLAGNYALVTNIDAKDTGPTATIPWMKGGFQGLGSTGNPFTGQFHGLGHIISNLTVSPQVSSPAGLFGVTSSTTVIRDVGISAATVVSTVTGYNQVGALVGWNRGTVRNAWVDSNTKVKGDTDVGGLIGQNDGTISQSYSSATVTALNDAAGGLVGLNSVGATIGNTGVDSKATVTGNNDVGGLVGENDGAISQSHSSATVTALNHAAGGLVGLNSGSLKSSGEIRDAWVDSKATVTGYTDVGGLVGQNDWKIYNSYSSATVTATHDTAGGLVGHNTFDIAFSYANGPVSVSPTGAATNGAGGLIGLNEGGQADDCYAAAVSLSGPRTGGFTANERGLASESYWVGSGSDASQATHLSAAASLQQSSYVGTFWDFNSFWRIYDGHTTPLLAEFLTPLTITAPPTSVTYNGNTFSPGLFNATYSVASAAGSPNLFAAGVRNVGTYQPDVWSNQQGYNITMSGGTLTINPAPLTLAAVSDSKIYDGTTSSGKKVDVKGLVSGDILNATQAFASKDVKGNNGSTLQVASGYTITDASGANMLGNYTIDASKTATGTITPAPLTVTTLSVTKTYDGTTRADGHAVVDSTSGTKLFGSDTLFGGTFAFTDKNVGAGKTVTVSGVTVEDGNNGNDYTVSYTNDTHSTLNRAFLALVPVSDSKTYDGNTSSSQKVDVLGLAVGDVASATQAYASKDVLGTNGSTLKVSSGYTVTDATGANMLGNYWVFDNQTATGTITQAALTVTTQDVSKTYDGTTSAAGKAIVAPGATKLFGSDTLSGGTFAFADKNAGSNKIVKTSGVTVLDGNNGKDYAITYADNTTSTINKANLTLAAVSDSKTYDGTTGSNAKVDAKGMVSGDIVSATQAYASKDVLGTNGSTLQVSSGYTLTDATGANMLGNYMINASKTATGTITPATLTVTTQDVSKTYDGTLNAPTGRAIVASGGTKLFGSDTLSGGTFAFTDKNAGTGKTVTTNGVTVVDGNGGNDYTVTYVNNTNSTITKAALTLRAVTDSRAYDADIDSSKAVSKTGLAATDTLTATQVYTSKDVKGTNGSALQVAPGFTVTDASGANMLGNYTVNSSGTASGTIIPAALSVTTQDVSKTYDGTTSAVGKAIVAPDGTKLFGSDTLSGGTFAFTDKNAGTGKTVTTSGVTVNDGNHGNDYTVTYVNNTNSAINPAKLILATTSDSKVYDGTTASTGRVTATGLVASDTLRASETYTSKDVHGSGGSTLQVAPGYTVTDANGANMLGNYTVDASATAAGTITPKSIMVSGITAQSKVYDGTDTATLSTGSASLIGRVAGDSVGISVTGTFANANAGTNKTVTLSNLALTGNESRDYVLFPVGNQSSTTATIAPASLTITANNTTRDAGASNPAFTFSYTGFVTGESVASLTTAPNATTTADTTSLAGLYPITPSGAVDPNYVFTYVPGALTVMGTAIPTIASSPAFVGAVSLVTNISGAGPSTAPPPHARNSDLADGNSSAESPDGDPDRRTSGILSIWQLDIIDGGVRLPAGVQWSPVQSARLTR